MKRIISSRKYSRNRENLYNTVCQQLRALREQHGLSQSALARLANMAPERISVLEDPKAKTKPNLDTLLRLAEALDVQLEVHFGQCMESDFPPFSYPVEGLNSFPFE